MLVRLPPDHQLPQISPSKQDPDAHPSSFTDRPNQDSNPSTTLHRPATVDSTIHLDTPSIPVVPSITQTQMQMEMESQTQTQMQTQIQPKICPLSPSSFKVSPSEALRDTNETAPSSINDDASLLDQATQTPTNTMVQHKESLQEHEEHLSMTTHSENDPRGFRLHADTEIANGTGHSSGSTGLNGIANGTANGLNGIANGSLYPGNPISNQISNHINVAGDKSEVNSTNSLDAIEARPLTMTAYRRHTTQGNFYKKDQKSISSTAQQDLHTSATVHANLPPLEIERSELSRRIAPRHSTTLVPIYTARRSRTSLDISSRQDSTNVEINKIRDSILEKRNMKKRRKEFVDDERVLVGNKISEGHENFIMAYNMLTGIRVAVSRCSGVMNKLTDELFKATKKLSFNVDGSELTPSSKYDFKFKDYCPDVFRELRNTFGLDPADYLVSITGKYILSELGSPGKSGSFFYYSRDYRFIIKTIHHAEHKQLIRILKDYYNHVKANPNTLILQIYGLHRVKMPFKNGSRKVHFLVMNNLFPPHRDIHYKYDLKGSLWGRKTIVKEGEDISKVTLKDLNWLEREDSIKFGPAKRGILCKQLESDVKFLKKINVMDYSLLLGVHDVKKGNSQQLVNNLSVFDPKLITKSGLLNTNPRGIDRNVDLPSNVFPGRSQLVFYGHDGGIRSTDEEDRPTGEIYYLGIIDCLTNYSLKKKLETFWRSLNHKRETISAVPATEYGDRFLKFIKNGIKSEKKKQD